MSNISASLKANQFRHNSAGYVTAGGWAVGSHWYIGSSDDVIDNQELKLDRLAKATSAISVDRKKQILQFLNYFEK